ncbi:hypothetical protein [Haloferula sp.]|uniref:hypothetical protein n=1 Tax=Haloferula sp. TaxID=2497595 RepID=UPI003C78EB34
MAEVHARLHGLLASAAPVGLIIRRGPSKQAAVIHWDRESDTFQLGQWLKGRIYERRSDLSPKGDYFIYFAMNGHWDAESQGAWTAISKAPYLKAIVMLPKGECWNGGGFWTGERSYWLNDGYGHSELRNTTEVRRDADFTPSLNFGGECPGGYYPRLLRDAWTMLDSKQPGGSVKFHKELWDGWVLEKTAHAQINKHPGRGCYWDEHQLLNTRSGDTIGATDWEWADRDRDRLVWAQGGKLWTGHLNRQGLSKKMVLHDFNSMKFEALKAPY